MNEGEFISFNELRTRMRQARFHVITGLALGIIGGIALALSLPRVYRAEVTVVPLDTTDNGSLLSGLTSQLGGLAALAGVAAGAGDAKIEALAYLRSKAAVREFIERNELLPLLFADRWDAKRQTWQTEDSGSVPSIAEGVKRFRSRVLVISEDRRNGIVTIAVEWRDRQKAAEWANSIVGLVNDQLRARAIAEAERALRYLGSEAAKSSVVEVQQSLYRLVESQLKSVSIAKSRQEYAFRVVDPATIPDSDDPARPNKILVIVLSALGGMLIGLVAHSFGVGSRIRGSAQ